MNVKPLFTESLPTLVCGLETRGGQTNYSRLDIEETKRAEKKGCIRGISIFRLTLIASMMRCQQGHTVRDSLETLDYQSIVRPVFISRATALYLRYVPS